MALYTLYIVNKAGGLIYSKDLSPGAKLSGNDYLRLASTFHSLHAISKQLAPVTSGGITVVDAPAFSLHCLESPTGLKIFATAKPRTPDVHGFLRKVYEFYADYALKNPFYEVDMPIRLRLFDHHVEAHAKALGLASAMPVAAGGSAGAAASPAASAAPATPMFVGSAGQ